MGMARVTHHMELHDKGFTTQTKVVSIVAWVSCYSLSVSSICFHTLNSFLWIGSIPQPHLHSGETTNPHCFTMSAHSANAYIGCISDPDFRGVKCQASDKLLSPTRITLLGESPLGKLLCSRGVNQLPLKSLTLTWSIFWRSNITLCSR